MFFGGHIAGSRGCQSLYLGVLFFVKPSASKYCMEDGHDMKWVMLCPNWHCIHRHCGSLIPPSTRMLQFAFPAVFGWDQYILVPKSGLFGGFLKQGYAQITHFNVIFHEINHPFSGKPPYILWSYMVILRFLVYTTIIQSADWCGSQFWWPSIPLLFEVSLKKSI